MTRWSAAGGWDIELIVLDGRQTYRVRHFGMLVGYLRTLAELEQTLAKRGLTLADLEEQPEDR